MSTSSHAALRHASRPEASRRATYAAARCMGEHFPFSIAERASGPSHSLGTTRDSAGSDCRILARGKYAAGRSQRCRPTVSTTAVPVAEQSDHAGAVTGIGVKHARAVDRADHSFRHLTVVWLRLSFGDEGSRAPRFLRAAQLRSASRTTGQDLTDVVRSSTVCQVHGT